MERVLVPNGASLVSVEQLPSQAELHRDVIVSLLTQVQGPCASVLAHHWLHAYHHALALAHEPSLPQVVGLELQWELRLLEGLQCRQCVCQHWGIGS